MWQRRVANLTKEKMREYGQSRGGLGASMSDDSRMDQSILRMFGQKGCGQVCGGKEITTDYERICRCSNHVWPTWEG